MALSEIMNQPFTWRSNIRKDTDIGFGRADDKTMRIACVVFFLKGGYTESSYLYRLLFCEVICKFSDFPETSFFQGRLANVHRNLVFRHQLVSAQYMITMRMGNKNGLYTAHIQPQPLHSGFRFPAG